MWLPVLGDGAGVRVDLTYGDALCLASRLEKTAYVGAISGVFGLPSLHDHALRLLAILLY